MKQLNTSVRIFGPFHTIEVENDRYICDGMGYQFDVIGAAIIEDYTPSQPIHVPAESVSMLNLKLILIDDGKLTTVQQILDSIPGDDGLKAKAYWSSALTARRDNYLVNQLWPSIGYTQETFDDAWRRAAVLNP